MAENTYVNKVSYNGGTLIDLTGDTALASDVAAGKYFHLATGERVVGTAESPFEKLETGSITPSEDTQDLYIDLDTTDFTLFYLGCNEYVTGYYYWDTVICQSGFSTKYLRTLASGGGAGYSNTSTLYNEIVDGQLHIHGATGNRKFKAGKEYKWIAIKQ